MFRSVSKVDAATAQQLSDLSERCERVANQMATNLASRTDRRNELPLGDRPRNDRPGGGNPRKRNRHEEEEDLHSVERSKTRQFGERDRAMACFSIALPEEYVNEKSTARAVVRAMETVGSGKVLPRDARCLLPAPGMTSGRKSRLLLEEIDRGRRKKSRSGVGERRGSISHPAVSWGLDSAFYWLHRHERPEEGNWSVFERALPGGTALAEDPLPRGFSVPRGGGVDWETARFCLETLLGLQKVPEDCNDNQDLSGLSAHRVRRSDWGLLDSPLAEHDLLQAGDFIVLFRRPTGRRTPTNPYVPLKFTPAWMAHRRREFESDEQELEEFVALVGSSESFHAPGGSSFERRPPIEFEAIQLKNSSGETERWVPAALPSSNPAESPSAEPQKPFRAGVRPDYVCFRCGERGDHLNTQCPTKDDPRFVPFYAKRRPCGVALHTLIAVTDPKDVARAPYYSNGTFYLSLAESHGADSEATRLSRRQGVQSKPGLGTSGGPLAQRLRQF